MSKSPEELLAMRVGGASIADNIDRAIDSGAVIKDADGFLTLPDRSPAINWARVIPDWARSRPGPPYDCDFLIRFLFPAAYAKSAVPHGCRACFKVKVAPRTVRELVAAWGIGKRIDCVSKWGVDFVNPYSQDVYAGYFYTSGLDSARALYKVVREFVDNDAKLGSTVTMTIKRGCSDYEAALGPSDKYEFAPELEELEAYLKTRYRDRDQTSLQSMAPACLAHWIDVAFRIGDDTYLDFTGGRRLRPKAVSYDPGET